MTNKLIQIGNYRVGIEPAYPPSEKSVGTSLGLVRRNKPIAGQ